MTVRAEWWWRGSFAICVFAVLPLLAAWWRGADGDRCAFDASPIDSRYQVRLVFSEDRVVSCCGLWCAENWLRASKQVPTEIWLVDEISGDRIAERGAEIVQSQVPSNPVARDYRHVFADPRRADEHIRRFRGRRLLGDERPFQKQD